MKRSLGVVMSMITLLLIAELMRCALNERSAIIMIIFSMLFWTHTVLRELRAIRVCNDLTMLAAARIPADARAQIPRIVWIFWDKPLSDAPALVTSCIRSVREMNPTWEIHVLNFKDVCNRISCQRVLRILKNDSNRIQLKSNVIRLYFLKHFGGVYIDATVYVVKPLDWVQSSGSKMVAYANMYHTTDIQRPVIENWFLACEPNHNFISAWLDTYLASIEEGPANWLKRQFKARRVNFQNFRRPWHDYTYLCYYVAIHNQWHMHGSLHESAFILPMCFMHRLSRFVHTTRSWYCNPKLLTCATAIVIISLLHKTYKDKLVILPAASVWLLLGLCPKVRLSNQLDYVMANHHLEPCDYVAPIAKDRGTQIRRSRSLIKFTRNARNLINEYDLHEKCLLSLS